MMDSHEEVRHFLGSRRDQEEGGGAGPSSYPRRDHEQGSGAGLQIWTSFSHQLFPNSGATDIVFVTLFRTAVGTAKMHNGERALP